MAGGEEPSSWPYFERAFRSLLWRERPQRPQQRLAELLAQLPRHAAEGAPLDDAFSRLYAHVREAVITRLVEARRALGTRPGSGTASRPPAAAHKLEQLLGRQLDGVPRRDSPDFHCDAGLGGLARWLRAAGYDARWWPGIDDDELLGLMDHSAAILLTTDTRLARRGVLVHGLLPSLLVPVVLSKREQYLRVASTLDLPVRTPRCMACGGTLRSVPKDSVRERVPPRTYPWRDGYFVCRRCGQLFWRGTHWDTIGATLGQAAARCRTD